MQQRHEGGDLFGHRTRLRRRRGRREQSREPVGVGVIDVEARSHIHDRHGEDAIGQRVLKQGLRITRDRLERAEECLARAVHWGEHVSDDEYAAAPRTDV